MKGKPLDSSELLSVGAQADHPERQPNWLLLLHRALFALRIAAAGLHLTSMKDRAVREEPFHLMAVVQQLINRYDSLGGCLAFAFSLNFGDLQGGESGVFDCVSVGADFWLVLCRIEAAQNGEIRLSRRLPGRLQSPDQLLVV